MSHSVARPRNLLLALLLVVPLLIGATVAAAMNLQPAATWSAAGEPAGAPVADSPAGVDPAELVDARRAASEAGSQAGFLSSGTEELVDGTGQLREGAGELAEGVRAAQSGSEELRQGLVELQAGTGQLGQGATQVADGVAEAVEQVTGLSAIQVQLLGAIDEITDGLAEEGSPEAREVREQLIGFRDQVEAFPLDGEAVDQLNELRDGAREISNQLNVPGYGFHDGIYSATEGTRELAVGMGELAAGVDEAVSGVTDLDDGAQQIDRMAEQNSERIDTVQRSLPAVQPTAGVEETEVEVQSALPPMYALLIAAMLSIGGTALAWGARTSTGKRRWFGMTAATFGLVAIGGMLLALLASGMGVANALLSGGVLLLTVLSAAVMTAVMLRLFGTLGGGIIAGLGVILQIGVVGWVWQAASGTELGLLWQTVVHLMPLHYATAGLTALGNAGSGTVLWLALGVLAVLTAGGALMLRMTRGRSTAAEHDEIPVTAAEREKVSVPGM